MHLATRADFGIFGAWDGALLRLWLLVAGGLCRALARAFRRHGSTDPSFRVVYAVGTALIVIAVAGMFDGEATTRVEPQSRDPLEVAVAVYTVIGWRERDGDPLGGADWTPPLLQDRYIRLWLFRHRHLAAQTLIADAVAVAQAQDRGIVLPELPDPVTDAPPLRLVVPTPPDQPSRPDAHRGHPDG